MNTFRKNFLGLALLAGGALAAGAAQARSNVDVQVNIGLPGVHVRLPVLLPPPPPLPVVVVREPVRPYYPARYERGYGDRDHDGIPDRYDRRYTPRWDRDGDGVPNRYDRHPNHYDGRGR